MRQAGWLGRLAAVVACAALSGCGSSGGNSFNDFFGGGTVPGGSYAVQNPARVMGVIAQRTSDQQLLILSSLAASAQPATGVAGVTVSLVELNRSGVTGASGGYDFQQVQPGTYTLRFKLPAALGGTTASFQITLSPAETLQGLPAGANL